MNNAEAIRISTRAQVIASLAGLSLLDAQEIAHDVIVMWLSAGHTGQTIRQATIDAIRKRYGRTGTDINTTLRRLNRSVEFKPHLHGGVTEENISEKLLEFIGGLEAVDQEIMQSFLNGYSLVEIGKRLGLTGSRIGQRLAELAKQAKKKRNRSEL